jgi:anti-sigma regulatory factor (Ser/Thr protein kinase)
VTDQAGRGGGFRHAAWLYRSRAEYLGGIREFVQAGLSCDEPVFLVVPGSELLGHRLPRGPGVTVADMQELGGNPARLIPALRAFADRFPRRRVRYLGEPAWADRSGAELLEVARHESLLNLAFADAQISALCPYNATELSPAVLGDACGAHPTLHDEDGERPNPEYFGPDGSPDSLAKLLVAPANAEMLVYVADLRPVRALVAAVAGQAGLSPARCTDLVIAASEVAANTLRHTTGEGVVRLWETDAEVLCQIEDRGYITDPLAGHGRPSDDVPGGQGLWLVNQLCDLAEIRSSELGTTIRLHMYRP